MGRPRLADVARHPHGGTVRRTLLEVRDDALSVNREARQRQYGIAAAEATQPEWGSVLGRLYKLGDITRPQLDAGLAYAQMRSDYNRVMMSRPMPSGSDLERQHGHDGSDGTDPAYVAWSARIRQLHERCVLALMATMDLHATAAIERVAVEDRPAGNLVGSLRLALNAVGKVLR